MQKFKALVSYMEQEELLTFGDLLLAGQLQYKDFIISHAKPICMVTLAHTELDQYKGKTGSPDDTAADNDGYSGADDTSEADDITASAIEQIEFPYHTRLKVVLYGGFDVFHREIQKYLPDLRIVEVSAHIDVAPIRNADIVFLQINKTNHSNYWTVCDACRNSNVPYFHLNYASAKRCAKFMVEEMSKLEDAQESSKE